MKPLKYDLMNSIALTLVVQVINNYIKIKLKKLNITTFNI